MTLQREVRRATASSGWLLVAVVGLCSAIIAAPLAALEMTWLRSSSPELTTERGHAQFRNLEIDNGRGSAIATFTAMTGDMNVVGNLHVGGVITTGSTISAVPSVQP